MTLNIWFLVFAHYITYTKILVHIRDHVGNFMITVEPCELYSYATFIDILWSGYLCIILQVLILKWQFYKD